MDCEKIISLIPEYSVDMLDGAIRSEVDLHLANCPTCAAEMDRMHQVLKLVDDLDQADPPADLWAGVYSRISVQRKTTVWDILRWPIPARPLGWSLGILSAVLVIFVLFLRMQTPADQVSTAKHTSDEFTQGHISYTNTDLFADPASINFSAALAYRTNEGVRVQ